MSELKDWWSIDWHEIWNTDIMMVPDAACRPVTADCDEMPIIKASDLLKESSPVQPMNAEQAKTLALDSLKEQNGQAVAYVLKQIEKAARKGRNHTKVWLWRYCKQGHVIMSKLEALGYRCYVLSKQNRFGLLLAVWW